MPHFSLTQTMTCQHSPACRAGSSLLLHSGQTVFGLPLAARIRTRVGILHPKKEPTTSRRRLDRPGHEPLQWRRPGSHRTSRATPGDYRDPRRQKWQTRVLDPATSAYETVAGTGLSASWTPPRTSSRSCGHCGRPLLRSRLWRSMRPGPTLPVDRPIKKHGVTNAPDSTDSPGSRQGLYFRGDYATMAGGS